MLRLYSALCVGRNTTSVNLLTKPGGVGLSYEESFPCLKDSQLDPRFRAAYCDVLLHVFTDVYGQSTKKTFCTTWACSKDPTLIAFASTIRSINVDELQYDYQETPEALQKQTRFPNPGNLQEFLLGYLFESRNFRMDNTQQNTQQPQLLLRVIMLVRRSFEFGIFKNAESLLLARVRALLGVSEDADHTGAPRSLDAKHKAILVRIKLELVRMVSRFVDLLHMSLFSSFLEMRAVREVLANSRNERDAKRLLAIALGGTDATDSAVYGEHGDESEEPGRFYAGVASMSICHADTRGLVEVLLDQLHHGDPTLSARSLGAVQRFMLLQNKAATLGLALHRSQLLLDAHDCSLYEECTKRQQELQHLANTALGKKEHSRLIAVLSQFTLACKGLRLSDVADLSDDDSSENDDDDIFDDNDKDSDHEARTVAQRMLFHIGIHEDLIDIVQRPLDASTLSDDAVTEILCAAYRCLAAFARGAGANQLFVRKHLDFMLGQMQLYGKRGDRSVPRAIVNCLSAVVRHNRALCLSISDQQLRPVRLTCSAT